MVTPARPDSPRSRSKRVAAPASSSVVVLPAAGRAGDPPPWPLAGRATVAQLAKWTVLWSLPQAVMWERLGCADVVASYVVISLRADRTGKGTDTSASARLAEALGRTPSGMAKLRWVIEVELEPAEVTSLSVVREPRRLVVED